MTRVKIDLLSGKDTLFIGMGESGSFTGESTSKPLKELLPLTGYISYKIVSGSDGSFEFFRFEKPSTTFFSNLKIIKVQQNTR